MKFHLRCFYAASFSGVACFDGAEANMDTISKWGGGLCGCSLSSGVFFLSWGLWRRKGWGLGGWRGESVARVVMMSDTNIGNLCLFSNPVLLF